MKSKTSVLLFLAIISIVLYPSCKIIAAELPVALQIWSSQESYSSTEDITLHWNEVENAYNYGITVRSSPYYGDDTIVYDSMLTGNSINIGTLPEGQYRFAMYAYNSQGSHGDLSNICYFTVLNESKTPAAPQIWSSQESYSSTEDITLHWNEVENAYNYGITVRSSPYYDDDTIVYDSMLTGNSINIGTLPEGQYRFAMYAYNSQGSHGDLSNICYFTVLNESKTPAAPQIWSSQESYSSTEDIILHWNEVENAYNYGITVRSSPYYDDDTIVYDSMLTGNSINIGTLPEGQYRFAMYAYNSQGSHGDLSNICYFTVQESVSEPAITLSDDSQIVLSMLQRTYFSKFPLQEFDYPIQYVGENAYKYTFPFAIYVSGKYLTQDSMWVSIYKGALRKTALGPSPYNFEETYVKNLLETNYTFSLLSESNKISTLQAIGNIDILDEIYQNTDDKNLKRACIELKDSSYNDLLSIIQEETMKEIISMTKIGDIVTKTIDGKNYIAALLSITEKSEAFADIIALNEIKNALTKSYIKKVSKSELDNNSLLEIGASFESIKMVIEHQYEDLKPLMGNSYGDHLKNDDRFFYSFTALKDLDISNYSK